MKKYFSDHSSAFRLLAFIAVLCVSIQARAAEPAKLAPALQPYVDKHNVAGAVLLVADKDKVLDLEAVGWMDIAAHKPMQTNCLFWIASMTKSFTTTLIMMLVDEGKVNVEDPVEKYLPEFKGMQLAVKQTNGETILKTPQHPMTVAMLMSHTSGISPEKSPRQLADKDQIPLREEVAGYAKYPLITEPGTKYLYNNHGINTLGRIIEVTSGMKYEEFLQQRLLTPLGMKDTTIWPTQKQCELLAKTYKIETNKTDLTETKSGPFTVPLDNPKRGPFPAGSLFSTAADVSIFCRMILNGGTYEGHRYISSNSLRQATSTQTGDLNNGGKGEDGYGFGWATTRKYHAGENMSGAFGHGGAEGTQMWIDPASQQITVFMIQLIGQTKEGDKEMKEAFRKAVKDNFPKHAAAPK